MGFLVRMGICGLLMIAQIVGADQLSMDAADRDGALSFEELATTENDGINEMQGEADPESGPEAVDEAAVEAEADTEADVEAEAGTEADVEAEADTDTEADVEADKEMGPVVIFDLIQMQRRAVAENPSLAAGAERVAQARQVIAQARSMYFPQIDMSYTYTFTWLPSSYTDPLNAYLDDTEEVVRDLRRARIEYSASTRLPSISQRRTLRSWSRSTEDLIEDARSQLESPQESTTVNVTLGWLLFDGFAREFANAMARYGYGEAQAAFREGQRLLLDAVAQAYYGAQFVREQVEIAHGDIAFYERLVKEAVARREVGRGSTSDVLTFETALYAARANLLRVTRENEMARIALAVLVGMAEGYLSDAIEIAPLEEETPETMVLPEPDAMISLAYAYRSDLEQHELGLKRTHAAVRREYAKFAPQIAAVGGLQTANVNQTGIQTDRIVSTVGINASLNLFSGGRRRAEVISARHARREAEWRIVEVEQKIAGEVRQALSDLKLAQEALSLQREAAECVSRNRDLTTKEYNAGKAMLLRLSQAQRDYVQAMGMLAQARVNLQRSWQALHAATGVSLTILEDTLSPGDLAKYGSPETENSLYGDKERSHDK